MESFNSLITAAVLVGLLKAALKTALLQYEYYCIVSILWIGQTTHSNPLKVLSYRTCVRFLKLFCLLSKGAYLSDCCFWKVAKIVRCSPSIPISERGGGRDGSVVVRTFNKHFSRIILTLSSRSEEEFWMGGEMSKNLNQLWL